MGTTVQYDGATIGTFSKSTKALATSARWMKDDIIITDTGMDADDSLYQDKNGFITVSDDYGTATHTESLTVTANGTYSAPTNTAYGSVTVAVPCDSFIESVIDKSVTQVTAEDLVGVTSIGAYSFYECADLESVELSDEVTSIGDYAFSRCKSLANINLLNMSSIEIHGFSYCSSLINVSLPNLTRVGGNAFYNCTNIETLYLPKLTTFSGGNYQLSGIKKIVTLALPLITSLSGWCLADNSLLKTVDLGSTCGSMQGGVFRNTVLDVLILRRSSSITTLANTTAFDGTPFASGGTGGTIYIPKDLYDELGTGSTLDYKAATNWSTIDGYGTITWAQIEGSQYENYYADGTPIT